LGLADDGLFMRKRLPIISAVLAGPLLFLLIAQVAKAPVVALQARVADPISVWSGLASWYGFQFEGRTTASGQLYSGMLATVAHPWLPFGSLLRLTNPKTGRSQLVRVNDRGPFIDNRDLDLSYIVAQRLGVLDPGVVRLQIELLEEPPRP